MKQLYPPHFCNYTKAFKVKTLNIFTERGYIEFNIPLKTTNERIISYLLHVDSEMSRQDFCCTVILHEVNWGRMTSVLPVSRRCVSCTQCGATTPGLRCEWQNNYTQCGPCASLATCPICLVDYSEGTTILQCRQCDRCAVFLQTVSAQENWSPLFYFFFF